MMTRLPDDAFVDRAPTHDDPHAGAAPETAKTSQATTSQATTSQAKTSQTKTPPTSPATPAPATPVDASGDERRDIARRIAAFRNLQIKLRQDRERYYEQTMARTRALLKDRRDP